MFGLQRLDLVERDERELSQVLTDLLVLSLDPRLVESVGARQSGIEPDSARFGLAELGAICFRDERRRQRMDLMAFHPAYEFDARGDIAPLIAATGLQSASVAAMQFLVVQRLQQNITEFGVT